MDCKEARPLLDANADHELPAPEARRIQQHIESCDACRRESDNLRTLSGALRTTPYHRAPQSLRARIIAGLPAIEEGLAATAADIRSDTDAYATGESATNNGRSGVNQPGGAQGTPGDAAPKSRPRQRRRSFLAGLLDGLRGQSGGFGGPVATGGANRLFASGWLAALVIALGAGAAGVALTLHRSADISPFADELVESHVRAQVSGRDIDVISTDRHTVKPWFNGRLDYSPPVEDLAASGFPLQGGRLDYLAHQRVGVLVYRYGKHVIDVYVFPQAASGGAGRNVGSAAPSIVGREGYSIAHWNAEGMTWWAISDAAPDALTGLEAALKARLQSGSERTEGGS
ncbi:anti-sigma factor (TIGR02949 family) [Paraburkholderia sp. GAS333]|uniref:anti-sigma factor family protein n=1 Tax=Paraburkholderia sp. GAS333 TaxID=3156279 RepID=UPI003D23036B